MHAVEGAPKVSVVSYGLFGDQGVFRSEATGAAQIVAGRFGSGPVNVKYNSKKGGGATIDALARSLQAAANGMDAENDILFIADEVITGFGRTGSWFATGLFDLKPDIVTLAKGITSAYFPLSASVISEDIWMVLRDASPEFGPLMHGFTYSGHPVGGAVGLANLDIMEREGLVENSAAMGEYLRDRLQKRLDDNPFVGEVRGAGLMIAVEFVADKKARRFFDPQTQAHRIVARKALEEGVLIRALPYGEINSFSPPLCITRSEIDETVDGYARGLDRAMPELRQLAG